MKERREYLLGGQVQGVGFRPFVYRTARRLRLSGLVVNNAEGVRLEAQGERGALDALDQALKEELPPLARIDRQTCRVLPPREEETDFRILASEALEDGAEETGFGVPDHAPVHALAHALVSPDVATCPACLADMRDQGNRRHGYAFTNCTDCGPRYSITRSLPYDRARTSMACFPLCPDCRAEYEDPANRRFHAQPNACPVCGPRLWLLPAGETSTPEAGGAPRQEAVMAEAARFLLAGGLLAVKGLGGFLLACDARNEEALARLRERKQRPHKSLAVMVADLADAEALAHVGLLEAQALRSPEAPIVVLRRRPEDGLPDLLAPDLDSLGLMLPCTPLHHLLLEAFRQASLEAGRSLPAALVMTSGNARGEPIALGNREALRRLSGIADRFLLHDRDILVRVDDSVIRFPDIANSVAARDTETSGQDEEDWRESAHFLRRARGFVPLPQVLSSLEGAPDCLLAVGAELKNTLCLTRGNQAFTSQHIGDLKNPDSLRFFRECAAHLSALLNVRPAALVRDRHPDYLSSALAEDWGREQGIPVLRMQHHFAHVYSVLAERGHEGPALGLALDGNGLGGDDNGSGENGNSLGEAGKARIWGGEALLAHPAAVSRSRPEPGRRLGRLAPFPLPGGDAATREPWRLLSAFLDRTGRNEAAARLLTPARLAAHERLVEVSRSPVTPWTSSCGRLFDAVAALLGLCEVITYEGQGAIRLEEAQRGEVKIPDLNAASPWLAEHESLLEINTAGLFAEVLERQLSGRPVGETARFFHLELIRALADLAASAAAGLRHQDVRHVALCGGVLHNMTIARFLPLALRQRGLVPLLPRRLPPGDGGLSLGQADWGRRALREESS